jgi:protein TonB
MASHADIMDRPEPLTAPFWGSVTLHVLLLGGLFLGTVMEHRFQLRMGSPTGGGIGGVMVNPVDSIPIPNRGGPENPVANDTQSQVPTPPPPKVKAKAAPKVKEPAPEATPLKVSKTTAKKQPQPAEQPNKFRDQQKYNDNQLYSNAGQRVSSPIYSMPGGGGGVKIGDSSPFGDRFGAYANLIRDNIARNWKTSDLNLRGTPPAVVVTFTIRRDGSVINVKVAQSSGYSPLDNSAVRAVYDAHLDALPSAFPRNQADVELRFELGK